MDDPLFVLLLDVLGDTFHSEDLDVQALAVREGILDMRQGLLVDLVHVHGETYEERKCVLAVSDDLAGRLVGRWLTSGGVQTATTSVAFEVFGLLMGDEKLQVLEITLAYSGSASSGCAHACRELTVVAPWSVDELLNVGVGALLLAHLERIGRLCPAPGQ